MNLNEIYNELIKNSQTPLKSLPKYLDTYFYNTNAAKDGDLTVFKYNGQHTFMHWITTPEGRLILHIPKFPSMEYRFEGGSRTPLHRHDYIELGYVVKGTIKQVFSGIEYEFPQGSFWLSDCSCCHQDIMNQEELHTIFFEFSTSAFNRNFLDKLNRTDANAFFQTALIHQKKIMRYIKFVPTGSESPKVRHLVEQMAEECTEMEIGSDLIIMGLLSRLLSILFKDYQTMYTAPDLQESSSLLYVKILAYLEDHYTDVSLKDVANHFHYTTDFISRTIKRNTGLSYASFIQKMRIEKAAQLLTTTSFSVEQIMEQVGYQNRKFFSDLFVRYKGVSPAEYRSTYTE